MPAIITEGTRLSNVLFWKREFWSQQKRIDGIGRPTDLAGEWAYRDAEYARDEARKLYRDDLCAAWAARNARRASLGDAA